SFARPGTTLALDFPNTGASVFTLLDRLDRIVDEAGGALYPAKDARMSAASFQRAFPRWQQMSTYLDPRFSSGFWRRVTE
ncbi:FAD-binding oxidoreductase, partial [Acinetobacter baumannii]